MLNYETLLSSYDDKLTLMQWLKKVEEALKDASATSFDVIKTGNATLKFAITFEDGTSLESGEIVLQQGESVASGEIRNGHLFLTLTNGQELDCGLLFNGEVPSLEVRSLEVTGGLIVGDDANAAIGGDLVVNGLTEVQNILAYGHVETETLTATGDKINAEKPVVEIMTGYSASVGALPNFQVDNVYTGVCKNGNKLTIVCAVNITKLANTASSTPYADIFVPLSIANRLFPVSIGSYNLLSFDYVDAIGEDNSRAEVGVLFVKNGTDLGVTLYGATIGNLALNKRYYLRSEYTFLLSDNLIN